MRFRLPWVTFKQELEDELEKIESEHKAFMRGLEKGVALEREGKIP